MNQQRLRGRPAHMPGPTFLSYTPNGRKLISVGSNNAIRVFQTGSDAEPTNIDDCQDSNTAVAAANDFFVTGSEDGTVCKYSLETNSLDGVLVRCTLPIRDVALSPDGKWAAVASDELVVKVVNTDDMSRVLYLRDQARPVKHVSFDHSGTFLAVSCSDGCIYVYSLSSEEPKMIRKVDGLIKSLETDAEASSKVIWHPDGRAFAAPTPTREVQVMSPGDWERQRVFKNGHAADITALAWSPNGGLLATTGADRKLLLWETKTQKIIKTFEGVRATILDMAWHPTENILSYTNNDGELYIHTDIVPSEHTSILQKSLQPAPFIHDPLAEVSANARVPISNGLKNGLSTRHARRGTPDSLDEILGDDGMSASEADGFITDDDGAGPSRKRPNDHLDALDYPLSKRRATHSAWQPTIHAPFQPGSTPWRGNRRYLALNLTGCIWTLSQDDYHNTITVEFYDRSLHRDFHFTDAFKYDKACLSPHGCLFSCPPSPSTDPKSPSPQPAHLYYRPHETWTTRSDFRVALPAGETATAIALSASYIVVCTSAAYVRIYSLFGVPVRVYRQKATPAVTCAAWRDYVLTIGNGAIGADGRPKLVYSLENVARDEVCQAEDTVALSPGAELASVLFSEEGDPCVYDSAGVLAVLQHWRVQGQARWVPVLDTTRLARLASGRKEERYFPVGVAKEAFHCIILKGGDRYPYFPRPLLTEFGFCVPVVDRVGKEMNGMAEDDEEEEAPGGETQRLEEMFVRQSLLLSLLEDLTGATRATHSQRTELARKGLEVDKALLQLLAAECRDGEERGMKALEIVGLMKDRSGKMVEAAGKVASRFGRDVLGEKIRELAERRLVGLDDDEDAG
ncbi:DNA polymerase alpha accessory factor Mcl1 [Coniosporium apollinis]|uniref:DNA polymerase alpha accessory factor Mcl1 n=1 Tax=Coniosporium apollinis TaxID=61459 RepID=A0ABQ9NXM4_9PEZI|nr:DNA polymerase alpha accessory factor Mcl1 [Coniosporium apollinis]